MNIGITLGVNKVVEQLDLDPTVSNIASALISGGITGGISAVGSNTYTVTQAAINTLELVTSKSYLNIFSCN